MRRIGYLKFNYAVDIVLIFSTLEKINIYYYLEMHM